jgi:hypothetical protein
VPHDAAAREHAEHSRQRRFEIGNVLEHIDREDHIELAMTHRIELLGANRQHARVGGAQPFEHCIEQPAVLIEAACARLKQSDRNALPP